MTIFSRKVKKYKITNLKMSATRLILIHDFVLSIDDEFVSAIRTTALLRSEQFIGNRCAHGISF